MRSQGQMKNHAEVAPIASAATPAMDSINTRPCLLLIPFKLNLFIFGVIEVGFSLATFEFVAVVPNKIHLLEGLS